MPLSNSLRQVTILVALFGFLLAPSAHAHSTCSTLFASAGASSAELSSLDTGLSAKFSSPKFIETWKQILELPIGSGVRVQVETAEVSTNEAVYAINLFTALKKRGLLVGEPRPPAPGDLRLEGTADVILRALRLPGIRKIHLVQSLGVRSSIQYFTSAAYDPHPRAWRSSITQKSKTPAIFEKLTRALLGSPDSNYSVTVMTPELDRNTPDFSKFVSAIRSLGITIERNSLHDGIHHLHLFGPFDGLFEVIRHPAIQTVSRFEKVVVSPPLSKEALEDQNENIKDLLRTPWTRVRLLAPGQAAPVVSISSGREFVVESVRDSKVESLVHLKSEVIGSEIADPQIHAHEVRSAKDYASYLRRHHGQDFLFLASYDGLTVPVFDGIVLRKDTQRPLANVSLKYYVGEARNSSLSQLRTDLRVRITQYIRRERALALSTWVMSANSASDMQVTSSHENYEKYILRAQILGSMFGLVPEIGKLPEFRESRIVVDVRDHGLDFEMFKRTEVQNALVEVISQFRPAHPVSVTFLWNDRQGVEIDRRGVRVYF